jgi:murein DD-endopeptidase
MATLPVRCGALLIGWFVLVGTAGCAVPDPLRASAGGRTPWRDAVAGAAQEMIGAPYRTGGRTPSGFDCSGLVVYSYQRAGFTGLPRTAAGLARASTAIDVHQLLPGDLLFFAPDRQRITHVALYVGGGRFVHARKHGYAVERVALDDPYWRRVLARAGRLIPG